MHHGPYPKSNRPMNDNTNMHRNYIWQGKRVLITGHTGFKGGWLCLWLKQLGAEIHGLSLNPPTEPNLFTVAQIHTSLSSDHRTDISDYTKLHTLMQTIKPEVVFHLAAQPLVQYAYDFPIETYATNVMGTVHVLEAIRRCPSVRAAVIVTTDKCYENHNDGKTYYETDRLGGSDPYSNSKACAELLTSAYRTSYFNAQSTVRIASARAGNVIGGGDWAPNRLIPDCIRAHQSNHAITLRYPYAIRPWQHVLESINGYVLLAEHLLLESGFQYADAWNFGPELGDMQSVGKVAEKISNLLSIPIKLQQNNSRYEASLLRIDSSKAKARLHWYPRWNLDQSIEETAAWYRHWLDKKDMLQFSCSQIERYKQNQKIEEIAL